MATRTALGTWKAKASGTTLASAAGLTLAVGDCLIVGVGFQQTNAPASVAWGANILHRSAYQIHTTPGLGSGLYVLRSSPAAATRTLTATWASAIGARVMFAIKLNAGQIRDKSATATQTASAAPSVGPTAALDFYDDFAIAILCSEGPSSDTAPTVSGWTAGQRDGTVGVPPISNITVAEFYKQISNDNSAITCAGTGATARDWASCVVAFREILSSVPIDVNGAEILVGDTVVYGLSAQTSTVSSLGVGQGPFVKVTLANGLVYNAHTLEVV